MDNDSNPLETNSTPISSNSNRRKVNGNLMTHSHSSSSSSHSGSIFGDIDVTKLGTGNGFNGNKKVNNTSLRSSATLKSSKLNLDEEEDLLFGGHRHSPSRSKLSQKSTTTSSPANTSNSPSLAPSPVLSNASPSPLLSPVNQLPVPSTPKKSPTLSSSNALAISAEQENKNIPKKIEQPISPAPPVEAPKKEEHVKKEAKPTVSSSTSSFFKFFKSSSNSKTSSSASSTASLNAPAPITDNNDVVNSTTVTTPANHSTNTTTITNDTDIPTPPEIIVPTNQPKSTNIYKNIKQIIKKEKPVEVEEENGGPQIILDEATRAFAEDDLLFTSPKVTSTTPDYSSLTPELSMDALTIHTDNKKLNASISTPTRVDDPWSDFPPNNASITVEPSMSSPLVVKEQDIEPQKRSAFADLIQSWNTNQTNRVVREEDNDPEVFYDHIAEERRDIGFAGIQGSTREDNQRLSSMVDWAVEEDNPWN